jgi:hypothetical protein
VVVVVAAKSGESNNIGEKRMALLAAMQAAIPTRIGEEANERKKDKTLNWLEAKGARIVLAQLFPQPEAKLLVAKKLVSP